MFAYRINYYNIVNTKYQPVDLYNYLNYKL